ncbi:MAG TPA: diguanylate cyclase [Clostridiales bacterium]|nr:diguanylate cyclase [Clostridiales bacterium]
MEHNVLVVDDVPINRKIIIAILKKIPGIIFHEAINGHQALDYVLNNDIDLIILDLMMPVMDGFEVLKELKARENVSEIPVIVCSALDGLDTIEKALKMGAYDYFTKPLTSDQMKVIIPLKVRNALRLNQQRKLLNQANERLYQEMERVKYMSFHDTLTGLYNRAYLEVEIQRMEKDIKRFLPCSVLSIDMDDLKIVNDTFGHRSGDELLKVAAKVISKPFREVDIIARMGGDEFCVLLPKVDQRIVRAKMDAILRAVDEYNSNNPKIPLSLSIGLAVSNEQSKGIYEIYQEADDMMYKHKRTKARGKGSKVLELIMEILKKQDYLAKGHGERMVRGAKAMADLLNLSEEVKKNLVLLAKVHDLGKIGIPDDILYKKGRLTEDEYRKMKEHPRIGYNIARRTEELSHIAGLILHHHERYDGKGYPTGLKGNDIPLECRILSVLNAYDIMTHETPYCKKITDGEALNELKRAAGTKFDSQIVDAFLDLMNKRKEKNVEEAVQ